MLSPPTSACKLLISIARTVSSTLSITAAFSICPAMAALSSNQPEPQSHSSVLLRHTGVCVQQYWRYNPSSEHSLVPVAA
eukprot:475897-Rhodomonas_salina.3